MPNFNCSCDDGFYGNETLSELRTSLLVRLGYAAQAASPPPGMALLLNSFLQRGQAFLYRRYRSLETERMFTWDMDQGERFYGIRENSPTGDGSEVSCLKKMNPLKVTWAGVTDLNGVWLPLRYGIPPEFYTAVEFQGIPSHFEIRQCIEIFPAPSSDYMSLRIKGHFGLQRFTQDDDQCTLDSELVFLWALANAKNHYGQGDAADVASEAQTYLRELVAATHETRRYVPGTIELPQLPMPIFLPDVP